MKTATHAKATKKPVVKKTSAQQKLDVAMSKADPKTREMIESAYRLKRIFSPDEARKPIMKTTTQAKPEKPCLAEYEAWKDEQIRLGLEDFEHGRFFSHEEAVAQMDAHLKRLKKKHAKAA